MLHCQLEHCLSDLFRLKLNGTGGNFNVGEHLFLLGIVLHLYVARLELQILLCRERCGGGVVPWDVRFWVLWAVVNIVSQRQPVFRRLGLECVLYGH